jgi:hypothetical protein
VPEEKLIQELQPKIQLSASRWAETAVEIMQRTSINNRFM